jgi:carbon starvation protein CstA
LLLLVAQVPGLLIFAVFVWIVISILGGESRGEADVRVTFPIAVLLWAIANLAVMWSPRNSGES